MKKEMLESLGIPEEKWKEARSEYWNDVNTVVKRKIKEYERNNKPSAVRVRDAITAIIQLVSDSTRLEKILTVANNQYYNQCREQEAERVRLIREQQEQEKEEATEPAEDTAVNEPTEPETVPEESEGVAQNVDENQG